MLIIYINVLYPSFVIGVATSIELRPARGQIAQLYVMFSEKWVTCTAAGAGNTAVKPRSADAGLSFAAIRHSCGVANPKRRGRLL
jgi:hypothetical protein